MSRSTLADVAESVALDLLSSLVMPDGRTRWGDVATEWQWDDARHILGEPKYHFLTRSRGSSKTGDAAACALAIMLTELGPDDQCYAVAADRDQALLMIREMDGWVRRSGLEARVDVKRTFAEVVDGPRMVALAADGASAWGLRPSLLLVDEIANWPDRWQHRQTWEAVYSAVAKTPTCRMVLLTSAGEPEHWSHRVLALAETSPSWHVHEVPGPAPWIHADRLEEQRLMLPDASFRRLWLNEWTSGSDARLTTLDDVLACVDHSMPLAPGPHRYILGVDLGVHHDRTVVAVCHAEGDRSVVDDVMVWYPPVDLTEVATAVGAISRQYRRAPVVVDPWQAIMMAQQWRADGVRVTEYAFSESSIGHLAMTMYRGLRQRSISLPDDDDLIEELAAVQLVETRPHVWRMDHGADGHDDRAIAIALALTHLAQRPAGLSWRRPRSNVATFPGRSTAITVNAV